MSVRTRQEREQGWRQPSGAAETLLKVAERQRWHSTPNEVENAITNSPFAESRRHWQIAEAKQPVKAFGRRSTHYF